MRMENAERMLFCRDVVAKNEVKFVKVSAAACDRRNRVVNLAVRLRENKRVLVCL